MRQPDDWCETDVEIIRLTDELNKIEKELSELKNDAYFMRYHIHQEGLHDWLPEQRKKMEAILYDENDKLKR